MTRTTTTTKGHDTWRRTLLLPLLMVLALLGLTACSATSDMGGGPQSAVDQAEPAQGGGGEAGAADAAEADVAPGAAELADEGTVTGSDGAPMMVRSVRLEVLVDDVPAAVSQARAAATTAKGWVASEEVTAANDRRAGWATLVLRVPSGDLDSVVTALGELGEVRSSSSEAQDVTVEYRDVEARVDTLQASVDRLRGLVAEAPDVESIASLERELADREMELDALKARMKVLAEDVSRSTITLHLAEDNEALDDSTPDTGFLAGLSQGWEAFLGSVTVLLTAAGALLPFLALAALVLVPLLMWRRRRLASRHDRRAAAAGDPDRS